METRTVEKKTQLTPRGRQVRDTLGGLLFLGIVLVAITPTLALIIAGFLMTWILCVLLVLAAFYAAYRLVEWTGHSLVRAYWRSYWRHHV